MRPGSGIGRKPIAALTPGPGSRLGWEGMCAEGQGAPSPCCLPAFQGHLGKGTVMQPTKWLLGIVPGSWLCLLNDHIDLS